jgi:hypothetical protein
MALEDFEGMKGLSICLSLALFMMAHFLAAYLKRVRATSNRSREQFVPISNSLNEADYRFVQRRIRARAAIPPALPVRPGQRPSGPDPLDL